MTKKPSSDALAIRILSADGKEGLYIPFSQRLPEYLDEYRPEDGWRVERSVQAALELAPGLQALHIAAIQAGKDPASLGLPPLPTGMVYTARLVDKDGRVVMTASAYGQAHDMFIGGALWKDHEAAETAAYQRLIASLGYAGNVLDRDEAVSVSLAGKVAVAQQTTDGAANESVAAVDTARDADALLDEIRPAEVAAERPPVEKLPEQPSAAATAAAQPQPEASGATPVRAEASTESAPPAAVVPGASPRQSAPSSKQILAAKRRMITTLAKTLKVEAGEVGDEAAADAEIARLSAIGRERATA